MSTQLPPWGLDPDSLPTLQNIFFALQPDAAATARIERLIANLVRQHGPSGRPIAAARLHLTLSFIGKFADETPKALESALDTMACAVRQPPFEVVLDRLASFAGSPRPWVLLADPGIDLRHLHRALRSSLPHEHFTPHVTLLRDHKPLEPQAIETIAWTVREFVLLASHLGESRYTTLGRWPLQG